MAVDEEKGRKIATDCFRRGNEAVAKENWDYAIEMYTTAAKMAPSNLLFRQTLRFTEYKKYKDNKTGASMASMRLMGTKTKSKQLRMQKKWAELLENAESGLQVNPWDSGLAIDAADAARALGYMEVAQFCYGEALKVDPFNKDLNSNAASVYEERGEYKLARECWERILKADPLNGEARNRVSALVAKEVMDRGGYDAASSTRDVKTSGNQSGHTSEEARIGKLLADKEDGMSEEEAIERAIRKEPTQAKDLLVKLAAYYKREGRIEDCVQAYKRAQQAAGGGDMNLRELQEDAELDVMRSRLEIAKEQAQRAGDDPVVKKRMGEMSMELLKREIAVMTGRVERYPQDMRVKLELAKRLMRVQNFQAAIPLLQQARSDPRIAGESLVLLGKAFGYDKKPQLAKRQFEQAISLIRFEEQPDVFKDLNYTYARLCEEMGDKAAAENHYQAVIEVDYNFRDAVDRLNSLQTS
jgi:tetratricopeptide (TPR) repeat protein